jgi:hypothetical protein
MPTPPFRESISWIISPFKFWTATIFLHAHLQVVYYKCAKFHKNPISRLGGVALTRYMDGQTDGQGDSYIPPQTLFAGGITSQKFFNTVWCSIILNLYTDSTFNFSFLICKYKGITCGEKVQLPVIIKYLMKIKILWTCTPPLCA